VAPSPSYYNSIFKSASPWYAKAITILHSPELASKQVFSSSSSPHSFPHPSKTNLLTDTSDIYLQLCHTQQASTAPNNDKPIVKSYLLSFKVKTWISVNHPSSLVENTSYLSKQLNFSDIILNRTISGFLTHTKKN